MMLMSFACVYWLLNQGNNPHLTERDLLGLVRRGQVAKVEVEILEMWAPSQSEKQMEDRVDYSRGGRATFQVTDSASG